MTEKRKLTSVVSYKERGTGGDNKFRGNCSPKLIEDLINHFGIKEISDYMCGSNSTKAAADALGIASKTYEKEKVRQTLQYHTDIFSSPRRGVWVLNRYATKQA